jgi:hypothetical protein
MTPPNKPEWIELAEADAAPQGKKSTRALPALVLAAALSIVGAGALVGQSGAKVPANLTEQGLSVLASSAPADPTAPNLSSPSAISQPISLKQPSIATMPTGGGDDDDDEDDEGYEDDEDDDDEEGDDD